MRDVLPEEAEVLGGEGLAVGPSVALAQVEREDAAVLDLVAGQDVGDELEVAVVADQARVAVDVEQARVARAADQHPQLAAGLADLGCSSITRGSSGGPARAVAAAGSKRASTAARRGAAWPVPAHLCSQPASAHEVPGSTSTQRA